MAVLRTLPGRIKTLNTRRINVLRGEQRRVSGSARVSLKRRIWRRDAGHCCLCRRVVDLCDSELDHRIALQFGGGNEEYSAAIFLIPICISFDTAEKRRYATYLILNRRFSFEF
ncbi:HNH endonuclease [Escherichia coli]|uniref:HNH endonuclease n=1 Tax=Escherichia coli TaxID=562 RepID=UPI003D9AB7E8